MVCFYFVMTVFATVGFGDIFAHSTGYSLSCNEICLVYAASYELPVFVVSTRDPSPELLVVAMNIKAEMA